MFTTHNHVLNYYYYQHYLHTSIIVIIAECCEVVARYTKFINGLWLSRAILYILMAAGAFAIYQVSSAPLYM